MPIYITFNLALPVAPETFKPSLVISFKVKQLQHECICL